MPRKGSYFENKFGEKKPTIGFLKRKAIPEEYVVKDKMGKIVKENWMHNGVIDRALYTHLDDCIYDRFIDLFSAHKKPNIMILGPGKGDNLKPIYNISNFFLIHRLLMRYREGTIKNKQIINCIENNPAIFKFAKGTYQSIDKESFNKFITDVGLNKYNTNIDVINLIKSTLSKGAKEYVRKDYSYKNEKETYFEEFNNSKLIGKYDYVSAIDSIGKHTFFNQLALFKSALLLKKGGIADVTVSRYFDNERKFDISHPERHSEYKKYLIILNNYFKLAERKYGMKFKLEIKNINKNILQNILHLNYRLTRIK